MKELTSEKACLALGYFDSVHLGHRSLIEKAREFSKRLGLECAVATFSNNAYKQFNIQEKQVYTFDERAEILSGLCDSILPMRFDSRLKNKSARDFLDDLLSHYNIGAFVCGYDYLFGAGAHGDADFLQSYAAEHGIECLVVPKFELNGERVSTTVVKELLQKGDVEKAKTFLGDTFFITGKVVHGRGAGRMFDIPTANIKVLGSKLLPAPGVYGTSCVVDGETYYGATNIGSRPTFGLFKQATETMLADFSDNIYDKQVKIYFHKFLRPITKFETPAQLSKQVHKDLRWFE